MARERARTATVASDPRGNQRLRTRKELLQAAARLVKRGNRAPTLEDVAAEALVSRATVYRYFTNIEALLVEAPLDGEVPEPGALFADASAASAEERVDRAEAAMHAMVYAHEHALKVMLAHTLTRSARAEDGAAPPVRQNRRLPLIEAALAPDRARFDDATYARLCTSLALVFGPEAMVVMTDVVPQSAASARAVKSWVVRTLVRAALAESAVRRRRTRAAPGKRRAR